MRHDLPAPSQRDRSSHIPTMPRLPLTAVAIAGAVAITWVASDVALGLLLGATLAFAAEPAFLRLRERLGMRPHLAALLVTTLTGLALAALTSAVLWLVLTEGLALARTVQTRASDPRVEALLGAGGVRLVDAAHVPRAWVVSMVHQGASRLAATGAEALSRAFSVTTTGVIGAVVAFATMHYTLYQWRSATRALEALLPLRAQETRTLLEEFRCVSRSALVGTLGTSLVQGALATAGYLAAGVPRAVLWGTLTAFASLLPMGGTVLVWGPLVMYLVSIAAWGRAVALLLWGIVAVVAVCDYVVRPWLVGGTRPVHPLLVLVALLGGVERFGLCGVIAGPVVMSVCVAGLRFYALETVRGADRPSIVEMAHALRWPSTEEGPRA